MPTFERDTPSFDVRPVAGSVPPPNTTAASVITGVAGVVRSFQQEEAAESKASDDAASEAYVSAFEDSLLDAGSQAQRSFAEGVAEEGRDPDLTSDDENLVKQARSISSRIDRLESAGKGADVVNRRRIAEYRKFKAMAPHLAPELRDLFKKQVGKAVLESMVAMEESDAAAATKEAQDQKNFYIDFLSAHNVYQPGMNTGEMAVRAEPLMAELRVLEGTKRRLELLTAREDIGVSSRRTAQSAAFRDGFSGMVIAVNQNTQNLITEADFDVENATPDERKQLRDQLLSRKHLNEIEVRDLGSDLDAAFLDRRINVINDQFDKAIEYVDGKRTLESLRTSNAVRNQMAVNKLMNIPGVADKMAGLDVFRGIDTNLIRAEDQMRIATEFALPIIKGLSTTISNPSHNPYSELKATSSPEDQVTYYKGLVDVLKQNLDNPEAQESVRNSIEAWSNQMGVDATEIPTGVMSSMFELSSNPDWLKVAEGGLNLNDNIISAMQEYGARIQNKMGSDLTQTLSGVAKVPAAATESMGNFKSSFLGVDPTKTTVTKFPRVLDVLDVRLNPDGSVSFLPVKGLTKDVKVRGIARDVTMKYGNELGKMVRTYAHTVNGDTNYEKAYASVLQSPGLQEFGGAQQNPEVQEQILSGTIDELRKMIEEADKKESE